MICAVCRKCRMQKKEGHRMDDEARRQLIRNRLKQQHGGKKEIIARYQPKYPDSAQREYIRLVRSEERRVGKECRL